MKKHKDEKHYQDIATLLVFQKSLIGQMRDIVKVTKMIPDAEEIMSLTEEFKELSAQFQDLAKKIKLLRESGPKINKIELH